MGSKFREPRSLAALAHLQYAPVCSLDSRRVHEIIHRQRLPLAARPHNIGQCQNQRAQILANTAIERPDNEVNDAYEAVVSVESACTFRECATGVLGGAPYHLSTRA